MKKHFSVSRLSKFFLALMLSFLSISATEFVKAIRPDASTFVVNCNDCCETDDITDCQFNEAISLLDVIISDIDSLTTFEETCCTELNSKIDALTTFEENCCSELTSLIDVVIGCSCCQNVITQDDIDTGVYTITNQGVYCLASDVTFTAGNAITINNTTADVILDLQGYTITGSGGAVNGIFVNNATGGTTIKNGSISGGIDGINIQLSTNVFIENVRIYSPINNGIEVFQSTVTIDDVAVNGAGVDGMLFKIGVFSLIQNSQIHASGSVGVHIDGGFSFNLNNVSTFSSGSYNYLVESVTGPVAGIAYSNCRSEYSGFDGYYISNGPVGVSYTDCVHFFAQNGNGFTVNANGGDNFLYTRCASVGSVNGFATDAASNTVVYDDCSAERNTKDGYSIACQTGMIRDSFASRNDNNGISLLPTSFQCQVIHSTALSNSNIGIEDLGTNNSIYSNTATSNGTANYNVAVPLQLKPTDITGYWINVDSNASVVGEYESKIDAILECSCCSNSITNDDIAGGGAKIITDPGTYCLTEDVFFNNSFAININLASPGEVILDLGGHSIIGSGTGKGIENSSGLGGITIRNGSIYSTDIGIEILSIPNIVLENIDVFNSATYGILVKGCVGLTLKNILIESSGNIGFYSLVNSNVFVENTTVRFANSFNILIEGMVNGLFSNVNSYQSSQHGFYIVSNPIDNLIFQNCVSQSNRDTGFLIEQIGAGQVVSGIQFISTTAVENGSAGFRLQGVNSSIFYGIVFKECQALANGTGFEMFGGTNHIFEQTNSSFNQSNGIYLDGCDRCQFIQSIFNNNGRNGMQNNSSQVVSQYCTFNNNIGNGVAIDSNGSIRNNQYINCIMSGNQGSGIDISSNFTVVEKCNLSGNSFNGVTIQPGVKEVNIINNYVINNLSIGVNDNSGGAGNNSVWGNYSRSNGTPYGTGVSTPSNVPISSTAAYWANVR